MYCTDDKGIFGTDLSESVEKRSVRYPGCTGFVSLFCRDVFEFLSREGTVAPFLPWRLAPC